VELINDIHVNKKFHPPFFLFLAWRPSWLEVGITGHNFERGPSKDHSTKVRLQLVQWFLRRRLKCEMLTDGRRTKSDDNSSHGLKARRAKKDKARVTRLPTKMAAKLKIEKRGDEILIVHCCFSVSQNEVKFQLQLHSKE
jgi:hypothetical protein